MAGDGDLAFRLLLHWWRATALERRRATLGRHAGRGQCPSVSLAGSYAMAATASGALVTWGEAPFEVGGRAGGTAYAAVACGERHALALGKDGQVVRFESGQAPARIAGAHLAVAAGEAHSLALRADDLALVAFGDNDFGQAPAEAVPGPFVAIAAGRYHSLALRRDGSVHCLGANSFGQAPPGGVQGPFVAIAAGGTHSVGLRLDGSVHCWGDNRHGQSPAQYVRGPFVAVACGKAHTAGLRSDGSVACFGLNSTGEAPRVRLFPAPGGACAVASGPCASATSALRDDGDVVAWGDVVLKPPNAQMAIAVAPRPAPLDDSVPATAGSYLVIT